MNADYYDDPCPKCGAPLQDDGGGTFDPGDPHLRCKGVSYTAEWCSAWCGYAARQYDNGLTYVVPHYDL